MLAFLRGIGRFWYDFIIGDDWKIAAAVVVVLLIGAGAVLAGLGGGVVLAPVLAAGVAAAFAVALYVDVRSNGGR